MSTLNRLPCLKESRLWTQGAHQIRWSERRCRVLSSSTASTSGFHPGWKDQSPPDYEVCPGWIQVGDAIWLSKHVQKSQGDCTPLCDRIGAAGLSNTLGTISMAEFAPCLFSFFFLNFILFLNLKHCISFTKYQNESATGIHVLPIFSFLKKDFFFFFLGCAGSSLLCGLFL